MRKSLLLLLVFTLAGAMFAAPWRLELTLTTLGEERNITIGLEPDALDGYDGPDGYDENIPLAPPSGPFAFSSMDDPDWPFMTMLSTDVRADDELEKIWQIQLQRGSVPQQISWNRYILPTGAGRFYLGFAYPGVEVDGWFDMTGSSSETFMPGQIAYLRFDPISGGESTPPYILSLSPEDGATEIPTNRILTVEVKDNETTIDLSSVVFTVNGSDVFSASSITPITGGYRLEYLPPGLWRAESEYEVYLYAEDTGTDPLSVEMSSTFHTGPAMLPAEWELPFIVWTSREGDTTRFDLSIGAASSTDEGFNMGYDVVFPIAVPGVPFAYFPLSDPDFPFYTMLTRDIRSSSSEENLWSVVLENPGYPNGVKWNRSELPEDIVFEIAAKYPPMTPSEDDWRDMSDMSSFSMMPAQRVFIRSTGGTDMLPPFLVSVEPENGAVSVPITTDLEITISDDGSGIDTESIMLVVEGVDVTDMLELTADGPMVTMLFSPDEPFPSSETIDWELSVTDNAANEYNTTGRFTTSYLSVPDFMSSIVITTTPIDDDPYSAELFFGLDEDGTDDFDMGLDLQSPPPPPGFMTNAYFSIESEIAEQLKRDIRDINAPSVRWALYLSNIDMSLADYVATWNPDELDGVEGNFEIAFSTFGTEPGSWADMSEASELNFSLPGFIHIRYAIGDLYEVYGTITDTEGNPIEDASIRIVELSGYMATTDSFGYYSIPDIPLGDYRVVTQKEGYVEELDSITVDGHTVLDIVLEQQLYSLSGYIYGPEELEGTEITLGSYEAITDEGGFYELSAPAGTYDLSISRIGFETISIEDFELVADTEYTDTLISAGILVNIHVDLEDYPMDSLHGTVVTMGDMSETTDLLGNAYFIVEDEGDYTITISRGWYQPLSDVISIDADNTEFDFMLEKVRATVYGTVYSDLGGVVEGAYVEIEDVSTFSDEDGMYMLEGIKVGERVITASYEGYSSYSEVTIVNDTLYEYDITLEWAGSTELNPPTDLSINSGMHNRMVFTWTAPEPTGLTLTGYRLYIYRVIGDDELVGEISPKAKSFILRGETGGFYYMTAVYGEDESDGTGVVTGFAGDDPADPDILILDFDDGARLAGSLDEENFVNSIAAYYRELCDITDENSGLGDFNPYNYKLVWIITGVEDDENEIIPDRDLARLHDYMLAGGSIYWEGADAGYDYYSEDEEWIGTRLFNMFGAEYVDDGRSRSAGNVVSLRGPRSFFEEGPIELEYDYQGTGDTRVDEFGTTFGRLIMRSQTDPAPEVSRIRMVAAEQDNYRSVISSVYLGSMQDGEGVNQRYTVIAWLLNYLYWLDEENQYSDVEEFVTLPENMSHVSAYPNPFNSTSTIEYTIGETGDASLTLQDIQGRTVKSLWQGTAERGTYQTNLECVDKDGATLPTGIYMIVLENEGQLASERILLVK